MMIVLVFLLVATLAFIICEYRQALKKASLAARALMAIEKFGHGDGHGRGYTCANMAKQALDEYAK